jgi:hypothetical protein
MQCMVNTERFSNTKSSLHFHHTFLDFTFQKTINYLAEIILKLLFSNVIDLQWVISNINNNRYFSEDNVDYVSLKNEILHGPNYQISISKV